MCLQDWAGSICQHVSAPSHITQLLAQHSFCFLEVALGFPITWTFRSIGTRRYMGKPVIISEKWVLQIFSQGECASSYKILTLSSSIDGEYRIQCNLYLQWLRLMLSPWKFPVQKDLPQLYISPLLHNYICSLCWRSAFSCFLVVIDVIFGLSKSFYLIFLCSY